MQYQSKAEEEPELWDVINAYEQEQHEQSSNMVSLGKAAGRVVECGDVVQLMHMRSGLFLTMLKSKAKLEDSAMRLELVEHGCVFPLQRNDVSLIYGIQE